MMEGPANVGVGTGMSVMMGGARGSGVTGRVDVPKLKRARSPTRGLVAATNLSYAELGEPGKHVDPNGSYKGCYASRKRAKVGGVANRRGELSDDPDVPWTRLIVVWNAVKRTMNIRMYDDAFLEYFCDGYTRKQMGASLDLAQFFGPGTDQMAVEEMCRVMSTGAVGWKADFCFETLVKRARRSLQVSVANMACSDALATCTSSTERVALLTFYQGHGPTPAFASIVGSSVQADARPASPQPWQHQHQLQHQLLTSPQRKPATPQQLPLSPEGMPTPSMVNTGPRLGIKSPFGDTPSSAFASAGVDFTSASSLPPLTSGPLSPFMNGGHFAQEKLMAWPNRLESDLEGESECWAKPEAKLDLDVRSWSRNSIASVNGSISTSTSTSSMVTAADDSVASVGGSISSSIGSRISTSIIMGSNSSSSMVTAIADDDLQPFQPFVRRSVSPVGVDGIMFLGLDDDVMGVWDDPDWFWEAV